MCRLYHILLVPLDNGLRMIANLIRPLFMREVCFIDKCLVYLTSTMKMIARVRSFCSMFLYVLNSVINEVSKYMKRIWWIGNHKTKSAKWRQHNSCFTAVNRNAPMQQIKHNRNMSVLLGWLIPSKCVSTIERRHITIKKKHCTEQARDNDGPLVRVYINKMPHPALLENYVVAYITGFIRNIIFQMHTRCYNCAWTWFGHVL